MRFSIAFVVLISTLLPAVFAIPVNSSERGSVISLSSKHNPASNDDSLSVARDISTASPELVERDTLELFERARRPKATPAQRSQAKLALKKARDRKAKLAANKAKRKGKGTSEAERQAGRAQRAANKKSKASDKKLLKKFALAKAGQTGKKGSKNAKITFGNDARKELDKLGLHGKSRKHAKSYHKQVIKQDMERHGAASAIITHIAHSGGSDAGERFHITAQYVGHDGQDIHSHHIDQNGNPSESHHVYPEDQNREHPIPAKIVASEKTKASPAWRAAYRAARFIKKKQDDAKSA